MLTRITLTTSNVKRKNDSYITPVTNAYCKQAVLFFDCTLNEKLYFNRCFNNFFKIFLKKENGAI